MTEHNDKADSDGNKYQRPIDGDVPDPAEEVTEPSQATEPSQKEALGDDLVETAAGHPGAGPLDQVQQPEVEGAASEPGPQPPQESTGGKDSKDGPVEPKEAAPVPLTPVIQKMPSRAPGYLGLLLGLCALGLAGYLYYLTQLQDPLAPFVKRIDDIATRAEANSGRVASESEALRKELETALRAQSLAATQEAGKFRSELAAQQENLEAAQTALAESLGETIRAQPPTDRDWKLAEVEYLLRVANHRLLMERDALTAGQMLTAADKILAELGDFSLFAVRARLADEILSLKSLTGTDLQGLYLQLEALKNNVKSLPLRLPEYLQNRAPGFDATPEEVETATQDKEQTVWQEIGSRLSAFYQYRKIDGTETRRPLLSPDQETYLEMNLRLMLERAQLALMRRNQLVYEQSLSTAEEWIGEYHDTSASAVTLMQSQIAELLTVELELPIPDISGSLTALQAVSRGRDE